MKVLLIQDVDNLGQAGDVKEVAVGFGRNYLIPKGLAVIATPGSLNEADLHRRRAAERRQREADEMAALANAIQQTTLNFEAKAGETGRLFGSITTADVAEKLTAAVGKEIDRRRISLEAPIKQLGRHTVNLRLAPDVAVDFEVIVVSPDAPDDVLEEEPSAEVQEQEPSMVEPEQDAPAAE
jgi:large subunit ribosomal protein L9